MSPLHPSTNGVQTVRSLTKAQVKDNKSLRDVRVLSER